MPLHRSLIVAMLVCFCPAAWADPQAEPASPRLTMPDGSSIELPPGTKAFGPNGPAITPHAPEAEAPPPQPSKPALSAAERKRQRLDDLYDRLSKAQDPIEAGAIGSLIVEVLLRSGSDTADLLMQRAMVAMGAKDYGTAGALLDKIVVLQPKWAEAWNRRATIRFLDDDDVGAMADLSHVLSIEPRHFGALSGMGMILRRDGDDKDALTVLRRAAAINPQDAQIKALIDELTPEVEGTEL